MKSLRYLLTCLLLAQPVVLAPAAAPAPAPQQEVSAPKPEKPVKKSLWRHIKRRIKESGKVVAGICIGGALVGVYLIHRAYRKPVAPRQPQQPVRPPVPPARPAAAPVPPAPAAPRVPPAAPRAVPVALAAARPVPPAPAPNPAPAQPSAEGQGLPAAPGGPAVNHPAAHIVADMNNLLGLDVPNAPEVQRASIEGVPDAHGGRDAFDIAAEKEAKKTAAKPASPAPAPAAAADDRFSAAAMARARQEKEDHAKKDRAFADQLAIEEMARADARPVHRPPTAHALPQSGAATASPSK